MMPSALVRAWQSWKSAKAVAVLATLAFAVGVGSATAIYTVVNGVMLKPLPYAEGQRFVALYGASFSQPGQRSSSTFPDLIEYQQRTQAFDAFGWFSPRAFNMTFAGQPPQHIVGAAVTRSLASNLGVNPIIGQWFTSDDSAVIAQSLWRRMGADPQIVGKTLTLDGRAYTISGVTPPTFRLPVPGPGVGNRRGEIWIPLDPLGKGASRSEGAYFCYARRKPGVTLAQAEADVKRVAAEIAALDPPAHPSYTARLDDLSETVIYEIKPTLGLLVVAAGLLLLIACADVAGLLLSRAVARARETAIRVALGAAQRQLAVHYFAEGLLVAVAGGVAGVLVSVILVRVVLSLAADLIPRADEISLDWRVLLFALGAAVAASALASLAPLWQAVRTAPADVLSNGVRATASARTRRISHALVVGEIALAFTLLAVSAILVLHLRSLGRVAAGFDVNNLLTFELNVSGPAAKIDALSYQQRLTSALEGIAGVTSAGMSNQLPLDGCCLSTTIYPEGRPVKLEAVQRTAIVIVSPGFFRAMQIPLRSGRFLDDRDRSEDPLLVVINEAAVRTYWPDRNPIDAFGRVGGPQGSRFQIVGVVGDIRNDGFGKPTVPEIYVHAGVAGVIPSRFVVRSALPTAALVPEVRRAIQSVDPAQPIYNISTMREIARQSLSLERTGSFMVTFFALAALLMASLGIYGVVSYGVRQGTVEIGTRMALGALGRDLLIMVVGRGLKLAAYGAAIGAVAVAIAAWGIVRTFEIHDLGVMPFLISTAVVAVVVAAASFFPGWRATQVSPMVAIRNDMRSSRRSSWRALRDAWGGLARAVSTGDDVVRAPDGQLLTEFVAAARGATSFSEAFQQALATLAERLGATSVLLLENVSGDLRKIASVPGAHGDGVVIPADGFIANRLLFYSHPLPFARADLESWLQWANEHHDEYAAEIRQMIALDARIAVPLRARNDLLGLLILGPSTHGAAFSDEERQLLRQCGDQLTLMIENARLTSRVVEQEKLRRDVALAAEVQRRLLPERPPDRSGAALAAMSLPARSVGGDYYDFIDLGDQRIGIALADVAGKGVAAALIMAVVQASLRIVAADGQTSLPDLAARINAYLHRSTGSNSYATFFYAQLDERSRTLHYVNAGHLPPYLVRASDGGADGAQTAVPEIKELTVGGTVLGLFPQMSYDEATVQLQAGDVLVAFTDGVTEALNLSEEEFGEERLKTLLKEVVHLPAAEISARIAAALRSWIKDTAQYDDLTFVVLKVN